MFSILIPLFIPLPITKLSSKKDKERIANKLDERIKIHALTHKDSPYHEEARILAYDLCQDPKTGFQFFANNFLFIQDPESPTPEGKDIPFILYSFQEEAAAHIIKAIQNGYDLPIEKTRKMGMSWLAMAILVWGWNFEKWDCLVGSQKMENVAQRGNMKALLEKARYIIESSPSWLIPKLDLRVHDRNQSLQHPVHGATIAGESNNTNFGRSDRRKVILFDEFSSWELTDKAAWQSCGSTTQCRIPLSTPNTRGTNCHFFSICDDAHKRDRPILRLHWTLHPEFAHNLYKDELGKPRSPWYDKECERSISQQEVSQELDIDYEASMGGKVFSNFSYDKNVDDSREHALYNDNLPLYVGMDPGLDQTSLVWIQHDPRRNMYYIIDEYVNDGAGDGDSIHHYAEVLQSKPYKKPILMIDPHSGGNRSLTAAGNSNEKILRQQYGFLIKSSRGSKQERISAGFNIVPKLLINPDCLYVIEMFSSWQFIKPASGNVSSQVPKHDKYSHMGDAFTYFAVNYGIRIKKNNQKRKDYTLSASGVL